MKFICEKEKILTVSIDMDEHSIVKYLEDEFKR